MFFSLVLSIVGLFNSASENRKAIVEDYPFRLCYYVTAALLFFFTSLLGVKDAFRKYISERKLLSAYLNQFLFQMGGGQISPTLCILADSDSVNLFLPNVVNLKDSICLLVCIHKV